MKIPPVLPLAVLLAATSAARADVVIEQKVESATLNGSMVLKIRADQARMDMPSPAGAVTVLWNFKTGEMTTLMAAQKIAMKGAIRPNQPGAQAKPKPTGVTEKVGAYTAEVYESTGGPAAGKIWVARDYPNADALKAEMKKMSGATPMGFDTAGLDIPGFMVKAQTTTPAGPVTITVVSARQQSVPDSEFAIPAGYKEMGMGAPKPAAGAPTAAAGSLPAANVTPVAANAAPAPTAAPVPAKARRHWEGRFKELDTNGDGKLTLDEFLAGPMGKKTPEKAKAFFKSIDKNNTGAITVDQFVAAEAGREGETEPAASPGQPTATPNAPAGVASTEGPLVIITGVVLQSSDKGLLVQTPKGALLWLTDSTAKVQMTLDVSARKTGSHIYTAANGKQQTIDAYRATLK